MSPIRLNRKEWSKSQPQLSSRAETGHPSAADQQTRKAILLVLTTECRFLRFTPYACYREDSGHSDSLTGVTREAAKWT